jgi:hypothetical protein
MVDMLLRCNTESNEAGAAAQRSTAGMRARSRRGALPQSSIARVRLPLIAAPRRAFSLVARSLNLDH